MSKWIESAKINLIPLSLNKNIKKALTEWFYTGEVIDIGETCEICQLCNHPNIRYHFEIYNEITDNYLYVGSECIKRFGLRAIDKSGNLLGKEESRKLVDKDRRGIENEARLKRVINSILELSSKESMIDFETYISYLNENGAFTPKQLNLLIWKLEEHNINHRKSDYKMKMRRNREKDQLIIMPRWQIKKLLPCMTSNQRKYCKEHRADL